MRRRIGAFSILCKQLSFSRRACVNWKARDRGWMTAPNDRMEQKCSPLQSQGWKGLLETRARIDQRFYFYLARSSWRDRSVDWAATDQNVAKLKKHFVEFISVASGGPAEYTGKPIEPAHADMNIIEPEFEASIGDLKATLDHL